MNKDIDNPSVYWLEPVTSFELENTLDSQLDFPITPKAFLFRSFDRVENALESVNNVNLMLISFYLKHGNPQYQILSSKKITTMKVIRPIETESFLNAWFKITRGVVSSVLKFSLVDLPYLNP